MSGGQEKNFSTLGPKLRGSKALQYYGDKQRQICVEMIVYINKPRERENQKISGQFLRYVRALRKRNILGSSFTSPEALYRCTEYRQSSPSFIIGRQKHHGISNHVSVNLSVSECVLLFFIRSAARHFSFFRRASNDTIRTEPKHIIHGDHCPCMPAMISQVTWHY